MISILTHGMIGPLEDGIDLATDGMLWRNRAITEEIEKIALMAVLFELNAPIYPTVDERVIVQDEFNAELF
jgi:hypothetical protein